MAEIKNGGENNKLKPEKNKKSATNNQWTSYNLKNYPDKRPRRDGPGGEDAKK